MDESEKMLGKGRWRARERGRKKKVNNERNNEGNQGWGKTLI